MVEISAESTLRCKFLQQSNEWWDAFVYHGQLDLDYTEQISMLIRVAVAIAML